MVIDANNYIEQPRAVIVRGERCLTTTWAGILMARREEVV
ncbi:hypothetical protein SAMN04487956_1593 [Halomonas saccharevitans]|uniref:Uncharacterized protein n=1 Tax=Halomonas saccharevitans TaxID=416872 RepID=A0A1I7CRW6_9GAMM|nr:hypothetical protein SAMN04487956_1593 [Halomonas saccharevitans]